MINLSTRPRSFYMLLLDSLRLYKLVYLRTAFFTAIYTLLIILPNLVLYLTAHTVGTPYHTIFHSSSDIVSGFIWMWFLSVIVHTNYQAMTQPQFSLRESCKVARKKYFIYLPTSVIFAILSLIGFLLFVFPGVFIQILLGFFLYFILCENNGVIQSLKQSAELVWGNWWRCFAAMMIPVLMMVLIIQLVDYVFSFPVAFLFDNAVEATSAYSQLIIWILLMIFVPWLIAMMTCLYHDLKLRLT